MIHFPARTAKGDFRIFIRNPRQPQKRLEMSASEANSELKRPIQRNSNAILVVAVVFLGYQIYLTQNSFFALYNIALSTTQRWERTGSILPLFQLTSESFGEVGLVLRLVDACLLVTVVLLLIRNQHVSLPFLRKAVLLESSYFLFYIPFVIYLLARPGTNLVGFEAGLSYALQIVFVSPSLYLLYRGLQNVERRTNDSNVLKWSAIAFCLYFFGLWVKHFIFAIYAVGPDFSEPILVVGSLNSILTLLCATVGALIVFLPAIYEKRFSFSIRKLGIVLIVAGVYFVIFDLIALVNSDYARWVGLTEWWGVSLLFLGIVLAVRGN